MGREQAVPTRVREHFEQAGFEVLEAAKGPGSIEVRKYGCSRFLERAANGEWTPVGPPYFLVRGLKGRLEDRGYQKFWNSDGKRFPIRQIDLKNLHRFEEEVRAILGLKSLYHESLGSTCARSAYDRLDGRPEE